MRLVQIFATLLWLAAAVAVPQPATAQDGSGAGGAEADVLGTSIIELPPITDAGGTRFVTPIAVPDTYDLGSSDPDELQAWIAETIRSCLAISGYFDIYGPDTFFFDPASEGMALSTINFQNWYNVGAQGLVKTAFSAAGNQVSIDFRLFDIDTQTEIEIGFEGGVVPRDEIRAKTYEFINALISYYSGSQGIFGTRIAYVGRDSNNNKQVYVTTMDGSTVSSVTSNDSINLLPAFGPGGDVMYTSFVDGNPDIFIGNDNERSLSSRPGINSGAELSPSGSEIALTMSVHGNTEIYVIDLTGVIVRRCTQNTAEDVSPTWSPDGSQMAFVSDRSGGPQIYVMNSDCSGQARVTFQGSYNTSPDWSPLGDRVAFTGRDSAARFDIFTVEPSTNHVERLTQDQGDNREASWSPDGRYLVFTSTRGGGGSLYVMTEDGQYQTEILSGGYETPAWER